MMALASGPFTMRIWKSEPVGKSSWYCPSSVDSETPESNAPVAASSRLTTESKAASRRSGDMSAAGEISRLRSLSLAPLEMTEEDVSAAPLEMTEGDVSSGMAEGAASFMATGDGSDPSHGGRSSLAGLSFRPESPRGIVPLSFRPESLRGVVPLSFRPISP